MVFGRSLAGASGIFALAVGALFPLSAGNASAEPVPNADNPAVFDAAANSDLAADSQESSPDSDTENILFTLHAKNDQWTHGLGRPGDWVGYQHSELDLCLVAMGAGLADGAGAARSEFDTSGVAAGADSRPAHRRPDGAPAQRKCAGQRDIAPERRISQFDCRVGDNQR